MMGPSREEVLKVLATLQSAGGEDPVSRDQIRALQIDAGRIRFVIDAASAAEARSYGAFTAAAEAALKALPGVAAVQIALSAPSGGSARPAAPAPGSAPPSLKIGQHAGPAPAAPQALPGVARILPIASGKGGVGKSTLAANLAVALARAGRRVGLLDADLHGPSQPRMMGNAARPQSPDGKVLKPLEAHGVKFISLGAMVKEGEAVIWRGPMLMGALQQLLTQTEWGELDVLVIDLPPGTGDVQLTLSQRYQVSGALIVSTPQDIALIDARKAIDMFQKLNVPILGLVENMSVYICPNCGHAEHLFGQGGVRAEAEKLGLPLLAELPLALEVREGGDAGRPVAAGEGPLAEAFAALAARLIAAGQA